MRQLILKVSVSADGFMAGPGGEIDWIFRSMDDALTGWIASTLDGAGLHVMGSRTYRDMLAYWPYASGPLAEAMNRNPKLVFTRHPNFEAQAGNTTRAYVQASAAAAATGEADAEVLRGWTHPRVMVAGVADALPAQVDRLRREPGNAILAHGGAGFASSLVAAGCVDEYRLVVHPVVLGAGKAVFGALGQPLDLTLCSSTRFASGALANVYRPAGRRTASIAG